MEGVPRISKIAAQVMKRYQFKTFSVGVSLPTGIQEREDELRSNLRLKGKETIKTQMSKLIAAHISEELHKRVDKFKPDLTLLILPKTGEVAISSRPVFYYGKYTKPRGISQKKEPCVVCNGAGCNKCDKTGFETRPSVEKLLHRALSCRSESDKITFTWLGSEDKESKVFSPGRPFVAEIKNPVRRVLPRRLAVHEGRHQVLVSEGKVLPAKPVKLSSFRFKTEILATAASKVAPETSKLLHDAFNRREVRFERPHDRPTSKMVYRVDAIVHGRKLVINAELDGGLPIKRFISGELVSPSVSEVLKTEVRCRRFDIRGVTETGKIEFGKVARVSKEN